MEANGQRVYFGNQVEPESQWDSRPEAMPWILTLRTVNDGGERPLILTLTAPNQNATVGQAYAEPGAKYIGFVINTELEALCKKL